MAAINRGENHRVACAAAYLQDQFHGQQGNNAVSHRAGRRQHAQQVEQPGPDHREIGRQAVSIDDGGNRVGGVVKAVHELEAQGNQQRQAQQQERTNSQRGRPGRIHIGDDAADGEPEAKHDQANKDCNRRRLRFRFELRAA